MAAPENVRALFHRLWSKAVGTPDYVKQEWKDLERILYTDDTGGPARTDEMRVTLRCPHEVDVCMDCARERTRIKGLGTDEVPFFHAASDGPDEAGEG